MERTDKCAVVTPYLRPMVKNIVFEDIWECFQDPSAFFKNPNHAPFGNFVDFVQSQDAEKGIEFWCKQIHGLPRYDLHFKSSKNRDFLDSPGSSISRTTKYNRPRNTSVTFLTISHVAWALTLAHTAVFDDIFFCSFRSCRQMVLPGVEVILGSLWSMVPVRVRLEAKQSLENALRTVQDGIITATRMSHPGIRLYRKDLATEDVFSRFLFLSHLVQILSAQP